MALGPITTWSLGDILTAAALNAEFANVRDNPIALISPATGNIDLNDHLIIDAIYKNVPVTFTDQDGTPDVSGGTVFKTANTVATTISFFDSAVDGQRIWVIVNDVNTRFDFTVTNLKGNGGVDWVPTTGDHLHAVFVNPYWYCDISDNTP